MSELFAVVLTVQPDPLVQLKLEYRWAAGTWFNVTEQRHTGPDTVALCMRTPSTQVSFGDKLRLTQPQWRAIGSPLMLTLNEITTIKQVLGMEQKEGRE